jgi:stearoyl-CoA desaturase (delta-9 desaturase)
MIDADETERIAWCSVAGLGLASLHLACLSLLWLQCSRVALATCLASYLLRMFGITAGFHRYFSHRTYRTSRAFQCLLACLGTAAAQRGPLWWAAHHRQHHRYADTAGDMHSPVMRNLWWAHLGWILCRKYDAIEPRVVQDWHQYPELRWLDRHFLVPPTVLAVSVALSGLVLERCAPGLHTSGLQMLVYGFVLSTVLLYHSTFAVNSLAHVFGRRRFATHDHSRNNWLVALLTLGEGWHNNHHHCPTSERQGFYWWEIDVTHYVLTILAWCRIVWGVHAPPGRVYQAHADERRACPPRRI